jgi:oligopeptidase B
MSDIFNTVIQPKAKKEPKILTIGGNEEYVDNYFWLRDDSRSDPQILEYINAENEYVKAAIQKTQLGFYQVKRY